MEVGVKVTEGDGLWETKEEKGEERGKVKK